MGDRLETVVLTAIVSYVTLRLAEPFLALMGRTGVRVLTRIEGFLLAAVATRFILTGLKEGLAP
ncbi:MAG: MarC family protein [Gemmatimonadales bacterium]